MRSAYTYNLGTNPYLRGGLLLGLVVSVFPLVFEGLLSRTGGRSPFDEIRAHPVILIFFAHPLLLGLIFGAIGTIKRDLDRHYERKVTVLSGLAMTDPLTGLYNRRYVEEELMNLLHRAERAGGPLSVVFFDLDHFKEVNEKEGHRGGDLILKRVAEALQSVVGIGEILGRYGGDAFVLVVAADVPYATNLVERAVTMVKLRTGLTLSAGVARSSDDGTTPEELIAAADARLANVQARHHLELRHARPSSV